MRWWTVEAKRDLPFWRERDYWTWWRIPALLWMTCLLVFVLLLIMYPLIFNSEFIHFQSTETMDPRGRMLCGLGVGLGIPATIYSFFAVLPNSDDGQP